MRVVRYSTGNAEFDASNPPRVFFADRTMVDESAEFTEPSDSFDPNSQLFDYSDVDPFSFAADALGMAGTNVGPGVFGEFQIDPKVVAPEPELVILEESVAPNGNLFTTYQWEYYYSSLDILNHAKLGARIRQPTHKTRPTA